MVAAVAAGAVLVVGGTSGIGLRLAETYAVRGGEVLITGRSAQRCQEVAAGVEGLVRTLAVQLAPIRTNAIHPGVVGDSPEWAGKPEAVLDTIRARTPIGRLVTMDEIVDASIFLLENGAVNGVNLEADGGWM